MKLKLPKSMRGFAYDRVLPVELNNFDVDILLPALFFKVISGGQDRGSNPNDPAQIRAYVDALAAHEDVKGFETPEQRRLLDRLVRTSLVQIGRRGEGLRGGEQIQGLPGYTLLDFKPGFPRENSHLRKVDSVLYRMLQPKLRGDEPLRRFFEEIFGRGVRVRAGAQPSGGYDGDEEVDCLTRLAIALLDGFQPTGVRRSKERPPREACPAVAEAMARHFRRYLTAYRPRMPIEALTYHFKALINFELLIYTLKLFNAVIDLVEHPEELPPAMRPLFTESPPEVYLDFTGGAGVEGRLSRLMAAACVRRDIETAGRFVQANLTLRQLDRYVHRLRGNHKVKQKIEEAVADDEDDPEYLQALLGLLDDPSVAPAINAAAQWDEGEIRRANSEASPDEEQLEPESEYIERVAGRAESDFERVVLLLTEAQHASIATHAVSWYWSVGGLMKPHGILAGTQKNRQTWRYAPSNDLLAMLVQLAAVDIPNGKKGIFEPELISLRDFLGWLEERFGILVDQPPEGYSGAEYVAAAQENLRAMLSRLQQMGVFRDLSDDFTVQRLTPPYSDSAQARDDTQEPAWYDD